MINIDTFLEIGAQHKICEDYIISGNDPIPYIILSDGCSTANNSEMGSRILCHLAKQYLKYNKDSLHEINYYKLGQWVIHNAEQTARQLGLSISCLTATLIVAYHLDGQMRIMMYGDGSFIKVWPATMDIISVEFSNNAPYYLVYLIDSFRHSIYDQNKPTKKLRFTYSDGSSNEEEYAYDYPIDFTFMTTHVPLTLVTSDGIDSFLNGTKHLKTTDIVNQCIDFKTTKGEFLKRQMNWLMRQHKHDGISHFDDLSIGAFFKTEA